jgi:superfamily II DNA or RNA helicase
MITIEVGLVTSRIVGLYDASIKRQLDLNLSYVIEGVEFMPAYQNGWDGRIRLFNSYQCSFSTGLLDKVCSILTKNNVAYIIKDTRIRPAVMPAIPTNTILRSDQENVVKTCIEKGRGIIALPTGWGKSFSQIDLVCKLNLPTVIVVHKLDIMQQFIDWFKDRAGIEVGQIGNGIIEPKHITVAMVQTLANYFSIKSKDIKAEKVDMTKYNSVMNMCINAQVVITDEMHCMTDGAVWSKVFNKFSKAYYRLGFSATPYKSLSGELQSEAIYGPIIAKESYMDCIKKGYLTKPEVLVYRYKQQGLPYGTRYQQAYKEKIVENEDRNFVICQLVLKYFNAGKKVFIPVTHINHGKLLKQMLETVVGDNVIFLEGCKSLKDRQQGMKNFENGGKILLGTSILNEGVNIKSMDVLINARCSLSQSMFIQTIGRCLRLSPGKTKAVIIDIQDQNIKYFAYHGRARLGMIQDCEFDYKFIDNVDEVII